MKAPKRLSLNKQEGYYRAHIFLGLGLKLAFILQLIVYVYIFIVIS